MSADLAIFKAYAARLETAGHGERGLILSEIQAATNLSRPTIYKRLAEAGYATDRKKRADCGSIRCGLSEADLARIAGVQHMSKRKNKSIIMPPEVAVDILKRSGEIQAEASMATIRRHLRRVGLSRAQMQRAWTTDDHKTPTFHTQLKSKFPNHMHLFDITPCVQYFFNDNGKGLKQRDKNLQLYGTKMQEYRKIKKHLLRYVLVDHFSGTIFVQYFHASGERAADVIRFLWDGWRGGKNSLSNTPFGVSHSSSIWTAERPTWPGIPGP